MRISDWSSDVGSSDLADMLPIAPQRERSGVDRLNRSERVALDTRHLEETSNGIAGHAGMVLHRDLSGIFDLRIGCAHGSRQSGCRHRAGRADLALTADLGPGNGRVELDEHADRAGGQQDIVHARAIRTRPEIPIVAQHGGDDARGAVGGCSDDPSRSEEHTSELQSLMRISYAVFCLKK